MSPLSPGGVTPRMVKKDSNALSSFKQYAEKLDKRRMSFTKKIIHTLDISEKKLEKEVSDGASSQSNSRNSSKNSSVNKSKRVKKKDSSANMA